jgi:DNA excision repair protein ERCC-4
MGIQVVRVEIDLHEPREIRCALERLGAEVRIQALPIADYRTAGMLAERKTVRDLHATLAAGRLWRQMGRLRAGGRRAFLIVEGSALDVGGVSPAAIRGALLAVGENGVTVVRSETTADSALWLYRIACRAMLRPPTRDRPVHAQRPKSAAPEAILAAIPGISTVTARALLSHFGSVAAVVEATDAQLSDVSGIGPVRARSLREAFNLPPTSYRSRRSRERPGLST